MADSSSMLDSLFPFHSSFFARDNEALTKALQISISEPNTTINSPCSSISTSDSILNTIQWVDPTPPPTETRPVKVTMAPTGRVAKRKARASKRSQTTYINADPANFRQMVQQVTGIRFEPGLVDAPPLVKPEPQRMPVVMQQGCLLPTLDTSAHMLNQARESGGGAIAAPVQVERTGTGFGLESGMSFPTLESWGMIV